MSLYDAMLYLGYRDEEFVVRGVNDNKTLEIEIWDKTKIAPSEEELSVAMVAADFHNSRIRLMYGINNLTSEEISKKYPLYKQMNISNLSGYTQADKDTMLAYILSIRNYTNSLEVLINKATHQSELEAIVWKFP